MMRTRVAVSVPVPLVHEFFSPQSWGVLESAAADLGGCVQRVDRWEDTETLDDVEVLVTSWSSSLIDLAALERMPRLRLIAHTGATVKFLVTPAVFERGIAVVQAGQAMARPVAEVSLAFTLALLHRIHRFDHALRDGASWDDAIRQPPQHQIDTATVTVIGASRTGRAYLDMLRVLGARALVIDPTLSPREAGDLGCELVSLEDGLRRADILAMHAPSLPSTHRMIAARELALLHDGAGVVNTARSWLVDESALIAELRTGRLDAAIDVFDEEPLPEDHPFRILPNVLITPHRAAATHEGRRLQGAIVADEVARAATGGTLSHAVTLEQLETMA